MIYFLFEAYKLGHLSLLKKGPLWHKQQINIEKKALAAEDQSGRPTSDSLGSSDVITFTVSLSIWPS